MSTLVQIKIQMRGGVVEKEPSFLAPFAIFYIFIIIFRAISGSKRDFFYSDIDIALEFMLTMEIFMTNKNNES